VWHLTFYYTSNGRLYINSFYKQRLCVTRIGHFERYNEEGKITDSCLYYDNGKRQALWQFRNNCTLSAYKTFDTAGVLTGGTYWDEQGNERIIDPSVRYPSQPGGFQAWKKRVLSQINNDNSIEWTQRSGYYGSIHVKLHISREGELTNAFIRDPSGFPDLDSLVLKTCMQYKSWKPGTIRGRKAPFLLNCNFYFTAGKVTGYQQVY
jgi:TonB family protein